MPDSYAAKQRQRKCINRQFDEFFKKGKKIQQIPTAKQTAPSSYPARFSEG
jgi:hypothetical protein